MGVNALKSDLSRIVTTVNTFNQNLTSLTNSIENSSGTNVNSIVINCNTFLASLKQLQTILLKTELEINKTLEILLNDLSKNIHSVYTSCNNVIKDIHDIKTNANFMYQCALLGKEYLEYVEEVTKIRNDIKNSLQSSQNLQKRLETISNDCKKWNKDIIIKRW